MKKIRFFLILSVFSCLTMSVFAQKMRIFSSEIVLGTGIPIYADNQNSERKDILASSDYKRVVAGLSYNAILSLSEPIKLEFGADLMSDFLWDSTKYYHTLDYAFCTGIKVFPGAQGLNLSISYILGNRTDFYLRSEHINTVPESSEGDSGSGGEGSAAITDNVRNIQTVQSKAWGNGFKLSIQYDFLNSAETKVKPVVGAYYRCIPRGSNLTDHTLCIYGGIRF